jgi:hypothetical protein
MAFENFSVGQEDIKLFLNFFNFFYLRRKFYCSTFSIMLILVYLKSFGKAPKIGRRTEQGMVAAAKQRHNRNSPKN